MSDRIFDRFRAIDTDTHITEPADVWTSRVSTQKWGDSVPHVKQVEGRDIWFIRDQLVGSPGFTTMAGFNGSPPDSPKGYADILKSSYDADARLAHMDAEGIYAQVLYPNVGGFGSGGFLKLKEPELMRECVRAYNDFLVDWCSTDPNRLIPVAAMPFWDVNECVKEIERTVAMGHRAILACSQPDAWDEPALPDPYWDPFWAAAQDAGVPISFHIGAGDLSDLFADPIGLGMRANFGRVSSMLFMGNVNCVADLIFGGICHRFPKLDFVSVESGVGWIPFLIELSEYQFDENRVLGLEMRPAEYLRRQIYASYWFECNPTPAIEQLGADNVMFETDYPHQDGTFPRSKQVAQELFGHLDKESVYKIARGNAIKLLGLDPPD